MEKNSIENLEEYMNNTCLHDLNEVILAEEENISHHPIVSAVYSRDAVPQPVRFYVSYEDIHIESQHCVGTAERKPNFLGISVPCRAVDILTPEKKTYLKDEVIPATTTRLRQMFSVIPVEAPVTVQPSSCRHHTIPTFHSTIGVSDADYIIYVAAGPTAGSTIAWAVGCQQDVSGRLLTGRTNFGPAHINPNGVLWAQVSTATHEFLHAMGFSAKYFPSTQKIPIRGKNKTVITAPQVVEKVRAFFDCPTLVGLEVEDEGTLASIGSHLDRRIFPDEIMAASGGDRLSEITLSVFEAMGHYQVHYNNAEPMSFGRRGGCGFVDKKCDTPLGGRNQWWCFDQNQKNDYCTHDYKGIGACNAQKRPGLPPAFQYFGSTDVGGALFFDGCPRVQAYSNRDCTEVRGTDDGEETLGHHFGTESRCFHTDGVVKFGLAVIDTALGTTGNRRCLRSRCNAEQQPEFVLGDGDWHTCTKEGQRIDTSTFTSTYNGIVMCPDPARFCASHLNRNASLTSDLYDDFFKPHTPVPTLPWGESGATEVPQQESEDTVGGFLTIAGDNWKNYLDQGDNAHVRLKNALSTDGANLLRLPLGQFQIGMLTGSPVALQVGYDVITDEVGDGLIETMFDRVVMNGGVDWMPNTVRTYKAAGYTDTPNLFEYSLDSQDKFCGKTLRWNTCMMIIGCAVLVFLVGVLFIVYKCCCKKGVCCKKRRTPALGGQRYKSSEPDEPKYPPVAGDDSADRDPAPF